MKWRGRQRSTNVEDRRGQRSARPAGLKLGGGIGGIGLLVVVGVVLLGGGDLNQVLSVLLEGGGSGPATSQSGAVPRSENPADQEASEFVSVILRDTETTWQSAFARSGSQYVEPRLVLFSDSVNSACGYASSATGPFYCPGDTKIYLDTGFFRELERLGAPGDFAQAYVIAHEVGHHIQNISGTLSKVRQMQQRAGSEQANALQVLVELQADCLAGVWANHAETQRDLLETGDIEEGFQAAASIGDDRLQRNAGRRVQPESFTHGSSTQRVAWFKSGMESGRVDACDTFADANVRI
jgi:predicted metalloprotease